VRSLPVRVSDLLEDLRKLRAFVRRDLLVAWSYKTSFFGDWVNLVFQVALFYLVGRLVAPGRVPSYGGTQATYLEFVAIGMTLATFVTLALVKVASAIRQEQLMGTLESLLITPTAAFTVQLGNVLYDLLYIPVRTALFLGVVGVVFGFRFHAAGILPAGLVLLTFIPFVWGVGVLAAGATLTFRRGTTLFGALLTFLALGSGAYFPVASLPPWTRGIASRNPMTLAADGLRNALISSRPWGHLGATLLVLAPLALVSLGIGALGFRLALQRERRRGTLALY
jgi:ABC-2 type transport system permease protein